METRVLKITSKPTTKEAMQWLGNNYDSIKKWVGNENTHRLGVDIEVWNTEDKQWLTVPQFHFIIKGLKGEFYPCSDDVIHKSYTIE